MASFRSSLILALLSTSLAGCGLFGYGQGPTREQREALARQEELRAKLYDFVVIDCPPTLGLLTVNALVAATHLLVPIQSSYYSLEGTDDLLDTYEKIRSRPNPALQFLGVVITLHDKRTNLARDVREQIVSCRMASSASVGLPMASISSRSNSDDSRSKSDSPRLFNPLTNRVSGSMPDFHAIHAFLSFSR